jgi:hypothetical protein
MWHTPNGERALKGLEADVVRAGLRSAADLIEIGIEIDEPFEFSVDQFDALTPGQQLALLADVGRALFYEDVPAPHHSSINDAAIYVIFRGLLLSVISEIEDGSLHNSRTRQMVCELRAQIHNEGDGIEDEVGALLPDCDDLQTWECEIECLVDQILFDRDFELSELIVDDSPEKAACLKSYLGMSDYFRALASDPTDLEPMRRTLRELTRARPR